MLSLKNLEEASRILPLNLQRKHAPPCQHLDLIWWDWFQISGLQICDKINCCFKQQLCSNFSDCRKLIQVFFFFKVQVYFYVNSKISENGYFWPLEKKLMRKFLIVCCIAFMWKPLTAMLFVYFCSANCNDFLCVVSYQVGIFCFPRFNKIKFFHVSFCKYMFIF